MCQLDTLILRSQGLNPSFFKESWCGPATTPTVEGVLPTKLPSISMSAQSGVEDTSNSAAAPWSGDTRGASLGPAFGVAAGKTRGWNQEIREGFWPGSKDRQNDPRRPLCSCLHPRSADAPHAEPGHARVPPVSHGKHGSSRAANLVRHACHSTALNKVRTSFVTLEHDCCP
jgi:hypothetical protein